MIAAGWLLGYLIGPELISTRIVFLASLLRGQIT